MADQYGGHLDSWAFLSPNENYKQWVRPDGQLEIVVQKNPDGRWSLSTIAGALLAEMTGSSSANEAQNSAAVPDRGLQPTLDIPELATMAEPTATPTPEPTSIPEPVATPTPEPKAAPVMVADCPTDDSGKHKDTISFKGFYLGMPLGCAVKLINEKYSKEFGKIEVKRGQPEFREALMAGLMEIGSSVPTVGGNLNSQIGEAMATEQAKESAFAPSLHKPTLQKTVYTVVVGGNSATETAMLPVNLGGTSVIEADENQRVIAFNFPTKIVDALFNTDGINAQDFAQKFVDSYFPGFSEMTPFTRENSLISGRIDSGLEYTGKNGVYVQIDTNKNLIIESVPSSKDTKFD